MSNVVGIPRTVALTWMLALFPHSNYSSIVSHTVEKAVTIVYSPLMAILKFAFYNFHER